MTYVSILKKEVGKARKLAHNSSHRVVINAI